MGQAPNGAVRLAGVLAILTAWTQFQKRGSGNAMFASMEEVEDLNRGNGGTFFEPASMETYKSKIETQILPGNYFVTSERYPRVPGAAFPRRFTLRRATTNGAIETIGDYQAFENLQAALASIPPPFGEGSS